MTTLGYFVVLLSLLFFSIIIFILYKVRKIHLATYILLNNVAATRRETETLFTQIQALLALERKLNLAEALPPMRGWAGSPDFLLTVANETRFSTFGPEPDIEVVGDELAGEF